MELPALVEQRTSVERGARNPQRHRRSPPGTEGDPLTTKLRAVAAVAIAAALLAPTAAGATTPRALESRTRLSDRLVEVVFATPALEDPTPVRILLPAGYDDP